MAGALDLYSGSVAGARCFFKNTQRRSIRTISAAHRRQSLFARSIAAPIAPPLTLASPTKGPASPTTRQRWHLRLRGDLALRGTFRGPGGKHLTSVAPALSTQARNNAVDIPLLACVLRELLGRPIWLFFARKQCRSGHDQQLKTTSSALFSPVQHCIAPKETTLTVP